MDPCGNKAGSAVTVFCISYSQQQLYSLFPLNERKGKDDSHPIPRLALKHC